jgi:hypothetical protein
MHEGYKLRVEWGTWRFQAQMEKTHEKIWFYQTKVQPFV